jgi:hypothetical protein
MNRQFNSDELLVLAASAEAVIGCNLEPWEDDHEIGGWPSRHISR